MNEPAKGARKRALELIQELRDAEVEVRQAAIAVFSAQQNLYRCERKRSDVESFLIDVVTRCMPSLGSDDGK